MCNAQRQRCGPFLLSRQHALSDTNSSGPRLLSLAKSIDATFVSPMERFILIRWNRLIRAVSPALFLFIVVRPISVFPGLSGSGTSFRLRLLVGWFGMRGHWFYLLSDVRDCLWPTGGIIGGVHPHWVGCYRAGGHSLCANDQADDIELVAVISRSRKDQPWI